MSDLEKLPPTFRKAIEQARALHGLGLIFGGLAAFGIGGTKMKKLSHHTKHLVYRAEELANLPQDFNRRFQLEGWLISDSTSVEAAKKAIILYDQKKITEANTLLSTEFYGENLDFLLMRMKSIPEFRPRFEIARSAAALCQARQFTAAIPLIFIVLDGTASDAFGKSIFAEGIDVSETNAIAGSADSFPELIAIVSKIRRRTNVEEIFFPFRNGIIHGKDVNYGNRLVSAKCWSLLSCLCDILRAKQTIQEAEDERPLFELLKQYLRTKEDSKRLEEWSPRDDIEIAGEGAIGDQDFLVASPEYLLCEFLQYWRHGNYGKMGEFTVYFDMRSIHKRAGQIRDDLGDLQLVDARILEVRDQAPAMSEIRCTLTLNVNRKETTDEFCFRLTYMDKDMNPVLRGEFGGRWLVMPSYQGWAIGKRFSR